MRRLICVFMLASLLVSCSDNCVTCTLLNTPADPAPVVEHCEDSNINYTDVDGNKVSFKGMIESLESVGWTCD